MEISPDRFARTNVWPFRRSIPKLLAVLSVCISSLSTALANGEGFTAPLTRNDDFSTDDTLPNHYRLRSMQGGGSLVVDSSTLNSARVLQDDGCSTESPFDSVPVWVQIFLIVILILFSALFSGLTLGLMSLDKTGLEIVMEGEDQKLAECARRIYPVRKNGNLLLCTLLLGNVAVNALLSILLADRAGGTVGFVVSTAIIVVFGEILPQALCSRYALQIGSRTVPLVRVIMVILYPIAGPLAFALNQALGHELATTYSTAEMLKLLEIHVEEGRFDEETGTAMTGALKYKSIPVKEVMTPLEHTFMLNVDEKLSFETIATIFKTGYSRIPVYEISLNNIIGLLFVKDLIFIDPEDETPVRNFLQIFGRGVHVVWPEEKLGDVLRELKQGRSHMALVRDVNNSDEEKDPYYEVKGIITLEDIIEEIIGDEIVDETDAFVDGTHSVKVDRMEKFDWGRLRLLDAKIVDATLSHEEVQAVTAHLRTNHPNAVSLISDRQLHRLVTETSVTELSTAEQELGKSVPDDVMYQKGIPSDTCTLILGGKVTVISGADDFRSVVSSWSLMAALALTEPLYTPDFTAFVSSGPCRCLRFTRERFTAAVDASALERQTAGSRHSSDEVALESTGTVEPTLGATNTEQTGQSTPLGGGEFRSPDQDGGNNRNRKRDTVQSRRSKLIAAIQQSNFPPRSAESSSIDFIKSDALLENSELEK